MDDEQNQMFTATIYLKSGSTIQTETENPEEFIGSLAFHMDAFYARSIFRKRGSTVRLRGTPVVVVPIDHINFFTLVEKVNP
jgi:hypothetical protein